MNDMISGAIRSSFNGNAWTGGDGAARPQKKPKAAAMATEVLIETSDRVGNYQFPPPFEVQTKACYGCGRYPPAHYQG
jgi:hypothetical protein